jgi:hypothetical protein
MDDIDVGPRGKIRLREVRGGADAGGAVIELAGFWPETHSRMKLRARQRAAKKNE